MTPSFLEISSTLSELLAKHNISEAELGRQTNIPRGTINRLVNGKTPDPRASTLEAIAHFFKISVDQLLGKQPLILSNTIANTELSYIPIIEWDDVNQWKDKIKNLSFENHENWTTLNMVTSDELFAVRVRGESMWPNFQENTILIINPNKAAISKNFVIAYIMRNNEIVFRQLITEGSFKILNAINSIFPPIVLENYDEILGVLIHTSNSYE